MSYARPSAEQILGLSTITVGCGPGGTTPMLAKVIIVDYRGNVVFSAFVQPTTTVTNYYRTEVTPEDLQPGNALPFNEVQKRVSRFISNKIIVGHALWKNLSVLGLRHPAVATRDVALYQPFLNALSHTSQHPIGLQTLMWQLMRRHVQHSGIDPIENARAAMDLYRTCEDEWEGYISKRQWPSNAPPQNFSGLYL
ncbi:hypothetical protein FKP32DRAFT_1576379 [Trametes sanguinea]|nr:hypothetical protein FKP32DRAFT_1576379 [Trametes sanguinea]